MIRGCFDAGAVVRMAFTCRTNFQKNFIRDAPNANRTNRAFHRNVHCLTYATNCILIRTVASQLTLLLGPRPFPTTSRDGNTICIAKRGTYAANKGSIDVIHVEGSTWNFKRRGTKNIPPRHNARRRLNGYELPISVSLDNREVRSWGMTRSNPDCLEAIPGGK